MPIAQATQSNFKNPTVGLQGARIIKMLDLGTQIVKYLGTEKPKPQIYYQFELSEDHTDDGKPLVIGKTLNLAIGDRATLTKLIIACTGKKPADKYNPKDLVGQTCNLTLEEYVRSNGDLGVAIKDFSPLMRSQKIPEATNDYVVFELDNFDQNIFDSIHDHYKAKIMDSPEYKQLKGIGQPEQSYLAAKIGAVKQSEHVDLDDEIPFV